MKNILKKVYDSKALSASLIATSHASVILSTVALIPMIWVLWQNESLGVLRLLLTLGVPFVLVTLLRRAINAPRPYELYDFYGAPPKNKTGRSFPSRHAYSAFSIGVAALFILPTWVGVTLLILSTLLCIARVLLGIHFIRDVLAGSIIGVVCSIIGMTVI